MELQREDFDTGSIKSDEKYSQRKVIIYLFLGFNKLFYYAYIYWEYKISVYYHIQRNMRVYTWYYCR